MLETVVSGECSLMRLEKHSTFNLPPSTASVHVAQARAVLRGQLTLLPRFCGSLAAVGVFLVGRRLHVAVRGCPARETAKPAFPGRQLRAQRLGPRARYPGRVVSAR
jgi:hypothetical protein